MKRSNRLILLIGILLAAIAFVAVIYLLSNGGGGGGGTSGVDVTKTTIVVASSDVPIGTTLTADMVEQQEVAVADKPAGAFTLESEVIGRTVTAPLTRGQMLDATSFSTSTVTFDPNVIDPGKGAIAVQVDQVTGVGTLIKPGDRVDVVLSMEEDQSAKNPIVVEKAPTKEGQPPTTVHNFATVDDLLNNTTVKVLVQNLRVVGSLLPPPPSQEGVQNQGTTNNPSLNGQSQLVLLEVTPQQAELIRFTQLDGNLSLVLRTPADKDAAPVKTSGITLRQLVDQYGVLPPKIILTEQP